MESSEISATPATEKMCVGWIAFGENVANIFMKSPLFAHHRDKWKGKIMEMQLTEFCNWNIFQYTRNVHMNLAEQSTSCRERERVSANEAEIN